MRQLKDILFIKEKTNNLLLLEVNPGSQLDLICLGFEGTEKLFRLRKDGDDKFYTPFFGESLKPGGTYKWGGNSCTCASDTFTSQRNLIVDVAKEFFGFNMN